MGRPFSFLGVIPLNTHQQLLEQAYRAFSNRAIEDALALMPPGVVWPNGRERGFTQVRQLIKDLTGAVTATRTVYHRYQIENGRVRRMDTEPAGE